MPDIRCVCLSDLHLGEDDSLLTNLDSSGAVNPGAPSPVLKLLVECLADLLKDNMRKPTLILNGDLVELALADVHVAFQAFGQFIKLVRPLFDEVVYLPGNHDHHLWETARETQFLNYLRNKLPAGVSPKAPWHTTKVFMADEDRVPSHALTTAARRFGGAGDDFEVFTAYPNYGIRSIAAGRTSAIVFHHGHFIEQIYRAMSLGAFYAMKGYEAPADIYTLEKENFAWIDFFWSTMGRSVPGIERIYESTKNRMRFRAITDYTAEQIAERHNIPFVPRFLEKWSLQALLRKVLVNKLTGKMERQKAPRGGGLSDSGQKGLRYYAEEMLFDQIAQEGEIIPDRLSFVIGHTHKPFEEIYHFLSVGKRVPVFNTGGWVVESDKAVPAYGAAIALADNDLNVVNLRIYNEGHYSPSVAVPAGAQRTSLEEKIGKLAEPSRTPWKQLKEALGKEVPRRF